MMFIWAQDNQRPFAPPHGRVDAKQVDKTVQALGRPGPGKDHRRFRPCPTKGTDDHAGLPAHSGHDATAMRCLGMAVGIPGKRLGHDELLDRPYGAARGDVIRIQQVARAEGPVDDRATPDLCGMQAAGDVATAEGCPETVECGDGHVILLVCSDYPLPFRCNHHLFDLDNFYIWVI